MRLSSIFWTLSITASFLSTTLAAPQAEDGLSVESTFSFDPLVGLLTCLRADRPGYCFQKRALGYFESWVTSSENEDGDSFDADGNDGASTANGITPQWTKVIDQVAERISDSYGGDDEDEEDDETDTEVAGVVGHLKRPKALGKSKISKRDVAATEGRVKKYKKDKRVKIAMTVILLIIYFIINQLFYMFDKLARTAIFAKLIVALKIFVIVKMLELKRYLWWVKWDKKDTEPHHEVSLHDHHYDDTHDYYGPPEYYGGPSDHYGPPHWHSRSDAQTQAYRGQIPSADSPAPAPLYPPYTPKTTKIVRRR